MYETHFGLTKRPFRALATGNDVFVGPQTAATMTGLKKALTSPDSIVAIQGPVGVGKTTIVRRALEAVGSRQVIVTVGRMQLGHDEVLELLLGEMGAELAQGTVQRFASFRRLLKEHADDGTRVFFVVEDAARAGADALSELEALTASDAGVSEGANIVLMGDEQIRDVLNSPRLRRFQQRLRLRQSIEPLSPSELMGYFKHCFRLAGREFDEVFEQGSAEVLHRLSGGIPRIANNLVESSMTSAVENKLQRVNVAQIKLVASEEYGLDLAEPAPAEPVVSSAESTVPEAASPAPPQPPAAAAAEDNDSSDPIQDTQDLPELIQDTQDLPELIQDTQNVPQLSAGAIPDAEGVPELIQDTLPDLEIIAPDLARGTVIEPSAVAPDVSRESTPDVAAVTPDHPPATPAALEAAQVEAPIDDIPEWDRDPTLAELRPDLDALEHAMAVAQGLAPDSDAASDDESGTEEPAEPVPEITLDREIQAKIDKATEELRLAEEERAAAEEEEEPEDTRTVAEILAEARQRENVDKHSVEAQLDAAMDVAHSPTEPEVPILRLPDMPDPPAQEPKPVAVATPEPVPAPEPPVTSEPAAEPEPVAAPQPEPEPVAAPEPEPVAVAEPEPEPVVAPEPEPVADAQPKVNPELKRIAADLSRARTIDDCDDKMAETLFGEEFSAMAAEIAAMAPPAPSANDDLDPQPQAPVVPDFGGSAAVNVELDSQPNGLDLSASQRLATVRALNASPDLATQPGSEPGVTAEKPPAAKPAVETPESIEEQINTSMTQTLKALAMRPPEPDHDEDEDDKKSGFFSRFRRS